MDPAVIKIIASNASYIVAAFFLIAVIGWLWFRPGGILGLPARENFLPRAVLYPVLGWALLLIGASWLRIPAIPLKKSAPFLLASVLLIPTLYWFFQGWRRYRSENKLPNIKTYLHERLRFGWICLALLGFGIIPLNRLTMPKLYDIGTWGYDQINYIHIADQYLDHGLFEQKDTVPPGIFRPWIIFNTTLAKRLAARDFSKGGTFAYSQNPDVATVIKRRMGLIMRCTGAALDACLCTWFRLDTVQAYFLSSYLLYLLLISAGLWISLEMKLRPLTTVFISAMAGLWPMAVFPSLVDNRDQVHGLLFVLIALSGAFLRALNIRVQSIVLGALVVAYIEIFPLAIPLWLAIELDNLSWQDALQRTIKTAIATIAWIFPYLLWGPHFLLIQAQETGAMRLRLPIGEWLGDFSGLAGSFPGLLFQGPEVLLSLLVLSGWAFLLFQIFGLLNGLRARRFFFVVGFLGFVTLSIYFYRIDYSYAAYKLSTILFPSAVLLAASTQQAMSPFPAWSAWSVRCFPLLAILCLPALLVGAALRSGFRFNDLPVLTGPNSVVENRTELIINRGLRVRKNDVLAARSTAGKTKNVAFSNLSQHDNAYVAHFFRDHPVALLNGNFNNQEVHGPIGFLSSNMSFLKEGQLIDRLILLNSEGVGAIRFDGPQNLIYLRGQPELIKTNKVFTDVTLDPKTPFAFAQRIYSQFWQAVIQKGPTASHFPFADKGITVGIYLLNGPTVPRMVHFDVASPVPETLKKWILTVNGRLMENPHVLLPNGRLRFSAYLPASPAGHVLELRPSGVVIEPRASPEPLAPGQAVNEMTNFKLEEVSP